MSKEKRELIEFMPIGFFSKPAKWINPIQVAYIDEYNDHCVIHMSNGDEIRYTDGAIDDLYRILTGRILPKVEEQIY